MLDPKLLRADIEQVAHNLAKRGFEFDIVEYQHLEEQRKSLQGKTEQLQNERNSRSKAIGQAKAKGEDIQPLIEAVGDLGQQLDAAREQLSEVMSQLNDIHMGLPNLLDDSVPEGKSEEDNKEISRWGEPRIFDFEIIYMPAGMLNH